MKKLKELSVAIIPVSLGLMLIPVLVLPYYKWWSIVYNLLF